MTTATRVADVERGLEDLRRLVKDRLQGDQFANADRIQRRRLQRGDPVDNDGYFWNEEAGRFELRQPVAVGVALNDAEYLTLSLSTFLNAERRFVPGVGLEAVDGGANGDYTLNHARVLSGDLHPEYKFQGGIVHYDYVVDASYQDRIDLGEGAAEGDTLELATGSTAIVFTTIQQAVTAAMALSGSGTVTIYIRSGAYNEDVVIGATTRNMVFIGEDKAPEGSGNIGGGVEWGTASGTALTIEDGSEGYRFENIRLQGNISFTTSTGINVSTEFENVYFGGIVQASLAGFSFRDCILAKGVRDGSSLGYANGTFIRCTLSGAASVSLTESSGSMTNVTFLGCDWGGSSDIISVTGAGIFNNVAFVGCESNGTKRAFYFNTTSIQSLSLTDHKFDGPVSSDGTMYFEAVGAGSRVRVVNTRFKANITNPYIKSDTTNLTALVVGCFLPPGPTDEITGSFTNSVFGPNIPTGWTVNIVAGSGNEVYPGAVAGGDHATLSNLDFASAAHTGFIAADGSVAGATSQAQDFGSNGIVGPLLVQNTDVASGDPFSLEVLRLAAGNSVAGADSDTGYISFFFDDSTGAQAEFARILMRAADVTSTAKAARIVIDLMQDNTLRRFMHMGANAGSDIGTIVFNEDAQDIDLRIESANFEGMFYLDTSEDSIGIGNFSVSDPPEKLLHLRGDADIRLEQDTSVSAANLLQHEFVVDGAHKAEIQYQRSQNVLALEVGTDFNAVLTQLVLNPDGSVAFGGAVTVEDSLDVGGSFGAAVTAISSATTLDETHFAVFCDASGGAFTVTLPAASGAVRRIYHIKKTDSSGNAVTVDGNASETIDGDTTKIINVQYDSMMISCDGSNWHII